MVLQIEAGVNSILEILVCVGCLCLNPLTASLNLLENVLFLKVPFE